MQITVEKLPKSQVKLTIEPSEEQTKKYYQQAAKELSQIVKIPGFRPGHATIEILKQHIPEEKIDAHMIDIGLQESYTEAVTKEKLQVVARPQIKLISEKPFKYEAIVAIYPEVTISAYDKIKIKPADPKVEDKEIDEVLEQVRKREATHKEVDRSAQKGDKVEIDFEGFDEGGASLENTKSANHPMILGEGSLVEGFEDNLIGLKKGENKTFKVTFPKDYFHKKFQGKKVEFRVKMNKVEEVVFPEFTPEFLKKISGQDKTLEEIKADLRKNLEHDKIYQEKVRRENDFLEQICELTKVEIPETLIEEELDSIIEEFKRELESKNITLEQFLEANKKELKDLRGQYRKEAEKRLTLRFGLQKIFAQEGFDVTPEDMEKEIEHIVGLYPPKEQYKIREQYKGGNYLLLRLENKLKMEKLFDRFLGK